MPEMKTSTSSSRRARTFKSEFSARLLCRPLARLLVHRDGQLDAHLRVHVADEPALGVGQTEAAQADLGPVLSLGRNLELDLPAFDRRRGHLTAEERDAKRHRDHNPEVLALAREDRVRRNLDGRAQPGHAEHGALLHARGHLDLDPAASWQFDRSARSAVDLGQAHRDGRFDIELWRLLPGTPAAAAGGRAEDVAADASP